MHIHHQGARLVGGTVDIDVFRQFGKLHSIAQQEPAHLIGVGQVPLGGGVYGDDIVFREVIVVLRVGHPPGIAVQLVVVYIHIPLLHIRPVVLILNTTAEEFQLVIVDVVLVVHDIVDKSIHTILKQVGRRLVVVGGLNRVAQSPTVEHGITGTVVGTQIVPGGPVHGRGIVVIPQGRIVGPEERVGVLLLGGRHGAQGGGTEGLCPQGKVFDQQIIL